MKLKAKELRRKKPKELMEMLSEIDKQIFKFKGGQYAESDGMIGLPTGNRSGVNWGLFNRLKRDKATILTVMTENRQGLWKQ